MTAAVVLLAGDSTRSKVPMHWSQGDKRVQRTLIEISGAFTGHGMPFMYPFLSVGPLGRLQHQHSSGGQDFLPTGAQ